MVRTGDYIETKIYIYILTCAEFDLSVELGLHRPRQWRFRTIFAVLSGTGGEAVFKYRKAAILVTEEAEVGKADKERAGAEGSGCGVGFGFGRETPCNLEDDEVDVVTEASAGADAREKAGLEDAFTGLFDDLPDLLGLREPYHLSMMWSLTNPLSCRNMKKALA
jgi:hypothetical protein